MNLDDLIKDVWKRTHEPTWLHFEDCECTPCARFTDMHRRRSIEPAKVEHECRQLLTAR